MAAGRQARALHHVGNLAAKQRDLGGIGAIGRRGEEPEKAIFPNDFALGVETLHCDVVEVAGPMHGRARGGLGHDEQLRPTSVGAYLRRQRREARRDVLARRFAEDTEARSRNDFERVFAVHDRQLVAAVAEESEMIVGEPAQEVLAFGELVFRQRRPLPLDFGDNGMHAVDHRLPVVDRRAHVVEDANDVR